MSDAYGEGLGFGYECPGTGEDHNWGDAEECARCGDDRCVVTCRACGYEDYACDD